MEIREEVMTLEILDNITWFHYREEIAAICHAVIWAENLEEYYSDLLIWNKGDFGEYITACALAILEYIDEVKECWKYVGETFPCGRPRNSKVPITDEVKRDIKKACRDYIADNTRFIEEE